MTIRYGSVSPVAFGSIVCHRFAGYPRSAGLDETAIRHDRRPADMNDVPPTEPAVGADPAPLPRHPRWVLPLIISLIVVLVACTNIGNAVWASWVSSNPLGLLALNSSNRYLLATSVTTDLWPFLVIPTLRLMAPDPLFYALGYLYRDRALHWSRRAYPGFDRIADQFSEDRTVVKHVLYPLLVIMPNNPVTLLAGVAAIPIVHVVVLDVIGTVGRVLLFRWIGHLFEDQIRDVLDLVSEYQRYLTIGSVVAVVLVVVWQVTSNRGLAGNIEELSEELSED
jgi:membrane protein YqaA with SNARE-associated domain